MLLSDYQAEDDMGTEEGTKTAAEYALLLLLRISNVEIKTTQSSFVSPLEKARNTTLGW